MSVGSACASLAGGISLSSCGRMEKVMRGDRDSTPGRVIASAA